MGWGSVKPTKWILAMTINQSSMITMKALLGNGVVDEEGRRVHNKASGDVGAQKNS